MVRQLKGSKIVQGQTRQPGGSVLAGKAYKISEYTYAIVALRPGDDWAYIRLHDVTASSNLEFMSPAFDQGEIEAIDG